MRTYILTVLCLALVLGVMAGCGGGVSESSVPRYDPRTPALDLSHVTPAAVKTDAVCTYIDGYVGAIDQAMAIIKAAPAGDPAGRQKSADDMRILAATFKGYYIPKEIETLGLSMRLVLAAYANMMQDMATGSETDMVDSSRLATGLMSDTADAAHVVQIQHGCQ